MEAALGIADGVDAEAEVRALVDDASVDDGLDQAVVGHAAV
jgi:hypothetical protein